MVCPLPLLPRKGRGFTDNFTKVFRGEDGKQFAVTAGGSRNTPLSPDIFLEVFDEEEPSRDWPYRELVGSLLWLSKNTRPDISNAVRAVARYMHAP